MIARVFCLVFLLSTNVVQSQNSLVDTLLHKSEGFYKTNLDSALYYTHLALDKAVEKYDTLSICKTYYTQSTFLIGQKKFDEAERILLFNLEMKDRLEPKLIGDSYYNLASIYYLDQHWDKALSGYMEAQDYFETAGDHKGLAKTYLQLGVIYDKLNQLETSDYFYEKSMQHSSAPHGHGGEDVQITTTQEENRAASKKMLDALKESDDRKTLAIVYYNLAKSSFESEGFQDAIEWSKESLTLKKETGFLSQIDINYAIIGSSYFHILEADSALHYLKKALEMTTKRHLKIELAHLISEVYSEKGEYENALRYSKILAGHKDTLHTLSEGSKIAEITARYDNQEKEKLISKQKGMLWLWVLIAGVAIIVALFLGRKYRYSMEKVRVSEIEKQKIEKRVEQPALILNNKQKVYLHELMFIKSDGNYLEFGNNGKTVLDRNTLKNVLSQLPPNFTQVHRSYVVNKNFIASMNSKELVLAGGTVIPLSRTMKRNLNG